MKNPFSPNRIILALATMFTLTGCELYFGGDGGGSSGDRWTYCANDGYYVCDGDNCEWAGPRCPDDPNYTCTTNADCAAGCYCAGGVCEEAGFCGNGTTCPDGFHCEEARSSCVPDTCTTSADCATGQYCDDTGSCTDSCICATDAGAQEQGWGYCDEARGTCEPTPASGSCGGDVTCNQIMTVCPESQVPLITDGCWTGTCGDIAACDVTPSCQQLEHEADCLSRTSDCTSVYNGINCTNAAGTQCTAGSTGCTCTSFEFNTCRPRTTAAMVFQSGNGQYVDVFGQLAL
jgi:hypothetical protein